MKRFISLLLAVVLVVGLLTVAASAATPENVRHYDMYVCLGDSIAAGFGPDNQDYVGLRPVDFAYHSIVANAVTADTFLQMARPGGTTSELRYYLESDFAYDASYFRVPFPEENAKALRAQIQDAVAKADLVTINAGSNDIFTASLFAVAAVIYADSSIPEDVQKMIDNYGTFGQAFQKLFTTAQSMNKMTEAINAFTSTLTKAYANFRVNWNAICKDIYALNPDVTLVAVGFCNPVKSLRMSGTSVFEIGKAMDSIAIAMNTFAKYNADYARQYLFADIYNAECYELKPVDDPEFGNTVVANVHPTHAGHAYIAEQIIQLLPERTEEPVKPTDTTTPVEPTTPAEDPCDGGKDCPSKAFTDVDRSKDSWMHAPIDWAVVNKITDGTSDTTFSPNAACTRAQAVTFLYRQAGTPDVSGLENPFTDVTKDDYFYNAVLWAVDQKITDGTSDTTFSPNDTCTRGQIVTFLFRENGAKPVENVKNPFTDVTKDDYFCDAVLWAVEQEITDGVTETTFVPNGACTRAHIVTFLYRAQ